MGIVMGKRTNLFLRLVLLQISVSSLMDVVFTEVIHFEYDIEQTPHILTYENSSFNKYIKENEAIYELSEPIEIYKYKLLQVYLEIPKNIEDISFNLGWENKYSNSEVNWLIENKTLKRLDTLSMYTFELDKPDKPFFPIFELASKFKIVIKGSFSEGDLPGIKKIVFYPRNDLRWCTIDNIYLRSFWENEFDWKIGEIKKGDLLVFWFYYGDSSIKVSPMDEKILSCDSVYFSIEMVDGDSNTEIWRFDRDKQNLSEGEKWQYEKLDLSKFVGKNKIIRFRKSDALCKRIISLWGSPMIFREANEEEENFPPIILISCDTMRADRLIPYGYSLPTTPEIDRFSRDAVIFKNAYTTQTFTPVAHMSMLTGFYPENHGVTRFSSINPGVRTIFEILSRKGYLTSSFVGIKWWFLPSRGFARGVDYGFIPSGYCDIRDSLNSVTSFIKNYVVPLKNDRFFIFWHNFDLHAKGHYGVEIYDSESVDHKWISSSMVIKPVELSIECLPYKPNLLIWLAGSLEMSLGPVENIYLSATYDDCITKVDYYVGEFLNYLKRTGIYDKALIILTADHGEALGEHNRYSHDDVYENTIRVPLIIKFPYGKFSGTSVSARVILEDIVPTVVDFLDISLSANFDGVSLMDFLNSSSEQRESRTIISRSASYREYTLIRDDKKVIYPIAKGEDNLECLLLSSAGSYEEPWIKSKNSDEEIIFTKMLNELKSYVEDFEGNFHEFVLNFSGINENDDSNGGYIRNELSFSICADTSVIFYYLEGGVYRPKGPESTPSCVNIILSRSKGKDLKETSLHLFFSEKPQYLTLGMDIPFLLLLNDRIPEKKLSYVIDVDKDLIPSQMGKDRRDTGGGFPIVRIFYNEKKDKNLSPYRPTDQEIENIKNMGYF